MTKPSAASLSRSHALRPMRFRGERRYALALHAGFDREEIATAAVDGALLAYGFVERSSADAVFERLAWEPLGPAPVLVRPLRLAAAAQRLPLPDAVRAWLPKVALVAPFGRRRLPGFREISTKDPRISRLWDRFSIDIGVGIERNAAWVGERIFDRLDAGYRVFIVEDGDRYAIRALCIFRLKDDGGVRHGYVMELLHDRSVTGMRAASHLLGLALREMSDAGAEAALAWSLQHSGSYPIYARHAFLPAPRGTPTADLEMGVCAFDPLAEDLVARRERWYVSYLDVDDV